MIIEIKGLKDQKVKKINFEIEFENTDSNENFELDLNKSAQSTQTPKIQNEVSKESSIEKQEPPIFEEIENREPKGIPAEMLDAEF